MSRGARCIPCGAEPAEPCPCPHACPFTYNERAAASREVIAPVDWDSSEARLFQYAMQPAAVAFVQRQVALHGIEITIGDLWCPNSGGPYEILGFVEIASDGPNTDVSTTQGVRTRNTARPDDLETVYPLGVFLASFARVAR